MDGREMVEALRKCSVQTGSLMCLGCGHEHNCGIHGCAILRDAADLLEHYQQALAALAKANTFICRRNEALWTDYDAVCRERNAAVEQLQSVDGDCELCSKRGAVRPCDVQELDVFCHDCPVQDDCPCGHCHDGSDWEWCGPKEDPQHG